MSKFPWLNPLNSPYGAELTLQNNLSAAALSSIPERDAADDGMEVFIIRETKCHSDWYYRIEVDLARVLHYRETEHILEVERKFIQEVEALEHIRRSDIQNF